MRSSIIVRVLLIGLLYVILTSAFFAPAMAFWAPLTREMELKVDSFTGDYSGWSGYGAAPFLDAAGDGSYIEASDYCSYMGFFGFEDLALNSDETVLYAEFDAYARAESPSIDGDVYLFTSEVAWYWLGSIEASGDWDWCFHDAGPYGDYLDDEASINSAYFLIHYWTFGGSSGPKMAVDSAHLTVIIGYSVPSAEEPRVLRVPDMYPTIQGAIDAAMSGDTIIVAQGLYAEGKIIVNRRLTIVANGEVVVDGLQEGANFLVASDNVTIRGFTTVNGFGICLEFARAGRWSLPTSHCTIEGNTISSSGFNGIFASGDYNVIRRNKITNHYAWGVCINGHHNIAEQNVITDGWGGITISGSHNTIEHNLLTNNAGGIYGDGWFNTVRRNRLLNSGAIWFEGWPMSSQFNTITENVITGGGGIVLTWTHNNIIEKNIMIRNSYGIYLFDADYNDFRSNIILMNEKYGIYMIRLCDYNNVTGNVVLRNGEFDLYSGQFCGNNVWTDNIYKTKNW